MIAGRRWLWSIMTGVILIASRTTADAQQSDGPVIIRPSKSEIILQTGQNYTLLCKGKSQIQLKQQEISEDISGDFYMEQRYETSDNDSEYTVALDLYNVDQYAVGYYACFDDTIDSTEVLHDIVEEPKNTAHISYIYIYVNGPTLFAPMRAFVVTKSDSKFVIECKPTTPDIKVKLTLPQSNKTPGSVTYSPKIGFIFLRVPKRNNYICELQRGNEKTSIQIRNMRTDAPKPYIYGEEHFFLEGETFTINCSATKQRNVPLNLIWKPPSPSSKITYDTNPNNVSEDKPILYNNITIYNATREDAGIYTCESSSFGKNFSTFEKIYLENPRLTVRRAQSEVLRTNISTQSVMQFRITINAYPPATVRVFRDNPTITEIKPDGQKYTSYPAKKSYSLKIRELAPNDTAIYTFNVSNRYLSDSVTYDFRAQGRPKVKFASDDPNIVLKYTQGVIASLSCEAEGYSLPKITWNFSDGNRTTVVETQKDEIIATYKIVSILQMPVRVSGNITCNASNEWGNDSVTHRFLVYEMESGIGIKDADNLWFPEGTNVALKCVASKYDFLTVTWYNEDGNVLANVNWTQNELSTIAILHIDHIRVDQAKTFVCVGVRNDGTVDTRNATLTVAKTYPPTILNPIDESQDVQPFQQVNMTCVADAVPPPTIEWLKDDVLLKNNSSIQTIQTNQTSLTSMIIINSMQEENVGTYECRVTSEKTASKFYSLVMTDKFTHKTTYLSIAGVIFFILIVLVAYLTWKIRKEKQFRKELAAAGLLYFKEGVTKSINPDLGIDEQAELLPYDDKFEFPVEKLTLGKQLGAGAFGVVYKAEARGIINAEESTTVAVKMVKKTADNMYIKALASELKIMVHLGRHINIVNLLGACTKNVGKRELIVIVEYCKFGNIHNYLQKHRDVFIDQLTDNSEKTLGNVNRGFSCSSGNSGLHSDYFGSNHTQETDNTFLNTANTNRSGRKDTQIQNKQMELAKVSESGYVQPEWRSNYESDYSFDGRSPRPLCSRDLLAWAFQIARGMEYLASRKVLHGDLAARNILLAEDNIVKICDFGLARSIYKNDEYQKKENSPLPVKWLAIECMTDRIFSTQSDVWSFGIVLWELFSLAKTPYPNVSPPVLLQWLSEGHRLEKPQYADDKLYGVMKQCWSQKPTSRPSFSQLQEILGSFLEDNVRNHYVDLNAAYLDMNVKQAGEEDYLAMVSAPDYNNLVTPSPHHYVNDARSFFPPTPTQLQHDDEGYLQMSPATRQTIFNARAQGTKFDFDARKLTPRVSEANSYGSESTPMLTLNNLPRSGSESDQEGNTSPYLNMCPRIEEETDDVFDTTKEKNNKNIQPSAVTNPTYITLTVDDEKKPQNFANNYINVNVPNGLVK